MTRFVDPEDIRAQWDDLGTRVFQLEQMLMADRDEHAALRAENLALREAVEELQRGHGRMHTSIHAATLAFTAALDVE